ncbi:MAG: hypothetical protein K8R53_04580 [Bacteroidales bacterium]|nr:hypothetical protein [Bacteroidales bacterium]
MKTKLILLTILCWIAATGFAQQAGSDNYKLMQYGFAGGNPDQASPPSSTGFIMQQAALCLISGEMETSANYQFHPGMIMPGDENAFAGWVSGVWGPDEVIEVNGDLTIPTGDTLTIYHNVQVVFNGSYSISVLGTLLAYGIETDSITFSPAAANPDGWKGLRFIETTPNLQGSSKLNYCRFEGGYNDDAALEKKGGALYAYDSDSLTVDNCLFTGNYAGFNGGAAFIEKSDVQVTNTTFEQNESNNLGGAVFIFDCSLLFANVDFINNDATEGGGVYVDAAMPQMQNCLLIGNYAVNFGGALYFKDANPINLGYCEISLNEVDNLGGGIYCENSSPHFTHFTITENTAFNNGDGIYAENSSVPYLNHCILYDNGTDEFEGVSGSSLSADYSDIKNESPTGTGNIDADPLFTDAGTGDFTLSWTGFPYFDGTKSPCMDAGDQAAPRNADGTFADMGVYVFDQSSHTVLGGDVSGLWTQAASPYLITDEINIPIDSSLTIEPGVEIFFLEHYKFMVFGQILAQGIEADSILFSVQDTTGFYNNAHYGWHGLRFIDGNTTGQPQSLIDYCRFEYGLATSSSGGAIYCSNSSAIIISNCLFEKNRSDGGGGGAISCYPNSNIEISSSTFINNSCTSSGGALHFDTSSPLCFNLTITQNSANWGGGIAAYNGADAIIRYSLIANNSATDLGAGIHTYTSYPAIIYSTIVGNDTPSSGGGLYVGYPGSGGNAQVVNCIIWDNSTDQVNEETGGLINMSYTDIENGWTGTGNINSDPLFTDPLNNDFTLSWANYPYHDTTRSPCINTGDPTSDGDPDGTIADMGALYYDMTGCGEVSGTWELANSPIMLGGNTCIPVGSTLTIEPGVDVVFTENWPLWVYGQLLAEGTESDTILFTAQDEITGWNGIRFYDNNTNGQDSSKVVYCQLEYGNATDDTIPEQRGGALYFHLSSEVLVDNSLITDNTAYFGGGIYCGNSSPKFSNLLIENNTGNYGGGICNTYSDAVYENVIVRNNNGEVGGGMFMYAGAPQFTGITIYGNDATLMGGAIASDSNVMASISNGLIYENSAGLGGALWCNNYSSPDFDHVTFFGNTASIEGGTLYNDTLATPSFNNCILWNNTPQEISVPSGTITAIYSDIENGTGQSWFGTGCIDAGPEFAGVPADDYRLTWSAYPLPNSSKSPCIDAGYPGSPVDPDGTVTDMGAFWFEQWGLPVITSIPDVPNDQGKKVVINWNRSSLDHPDTLKILSYSVWREQNWTDTPWEYIGEVQAMFNEEYAYIAPTISDSTVAGIPYHTFKVVAETDDPFIFYTSLPDSGYSVDNLAPFAPENLTGNLIGDHIDLFWQHDPEQDFQYYAIYRSDNSTAFPNEPYGYSVLPAFQDFDLLYDTAYYVVTAFDFNGNESPYSNIACIPVFSGLYLNIKAFLEGPFNGSDMNTIINSNGYLPLVQPYNQAPWNYTGTEAVAAIPNADVVDWVLVELRDTTEASLATSQTIMAQQAAFLLHDGSVVGLDGNGACSIAASVTNNLFVVLWHRNSIGIMSAFPLIETGGIYSYDFTTGSGQAYGGLNAHKELTPGIWGMIGADGNADGQINNADKLDVWAVQAGSGGYQSGDFNLDAQVNNSDKNDVWIPNTGLGGQVPDSGYKCQVPE